MFLLGFAALPLLTGCSAPQRDPKTVAFLIQSSPASLDPRIGTDEPSEHIDELLFDGLVTKDAQFHFAPALAQSWEQPDIFSLVFSSARFPPNGANRGRYSNLQLDALLDVAAQSQDMSRRRADYVEAQQILARDLPAINLWYLDTLVVHNRRLMHVVPSPSGSYTFLETAELTQD